MSKVQRTKELYGAFAEGDIPTVLGAMEPDIEWREAEGNPYQPSGDPWIGPDTILNNLFVKLGEDWDGFAVHPQTFHDAGDTVVVEGRYGGAHGETGEKLDAQFCHVFTFRGDQVAGFQQFTDTAQMRRVMGVA